MRNGPEGPKHLFEINGKKWKVKLGNSRQITGHVTSVACYVEIEISAAREGRVASGCRRPVRLPAEYSMLHYVTHG